MKKVAFFASSLFLFFVFTSNKAVSKPQASNQGEVEQLEKISEQYDGTLSGAVLIESPSIKYQRGFGYANIDGKTKNSVDTIFLIGSVGKSFTAAATAKLVEQNKLSYDTPIANFFPEYPKTNLIKDDTTVTVRHLLNHTSGMPDVYDDEAFMKALFHNDVQVSDFLNTIKNKPLKTQPGNTYQYSNTGYVLLGEIVRRITQTSLKEFVHKNILVTNTLKKTTSLGLPEKKIALSYDLVDGKPIEFIKANNYKYRHDGEIFSDGNIYSSLRGLDHWIRSLVKGHIVTSKSWQEMTRPGLKNYGFGWHVDKDKQGNAYIGHNGYWIGYGTLLRYYPDLDLTFAFFSNIPLEQKKAHAYLKAINAKVMALHKSQ